ncbi:hypothetical protein [Amnibacterium kyonggiense]
MTKDMFARPSALVVGSTNSQWNALGSIARWFAKATAGMDLEDHASVDVTCVDGSRIERATVREARQALAELVLEPARVNVWGGDLYATNVHCSSDFRDGEHRIDVRISSTDRLVADGLHEGLQRFFKSKRKQGSASTEATVDRPAVERPAVPSPPDVHSSVAASPPTSGGASPQPTATASAAGEGASATASVAGSRRRALWNNPWVLGIGAPVVSGVVLALVGLLLPK